MPRFPNLPRIELATVDGQLYIIPDRPLTESVLIIGPAVDGPNDKPIRIGSVGEIEQIYGPVVFNSQYIGPNQETSDFNGNYLIKALREVQAGGAADVRLWRVGGRPCSGFFNMPADAGAGQGATGTVKIFGKFAGRLYNQARVTFTSGATSGTVTVTQPTIKGGSFTVSWSGGQSGLTIAQVIDKVNAHPSNRTVTLSLGTITSTAPARLLNGQSVLLTGGLDGTIKDDLATIKSLMYDTMVTANTGTFALLDDYDVDIVYIAGLYLDDQVSAGTTTSIAQEFCNFLGRRTVDHPMIGVIGCRPLDEFSKAAVATRYAALINPSNGNVSELGSNWLNAGYFMNTGFTYSDGNLEQPIDSGAYLQVVASDVAINDKDLGVNIETAAGIYAGLVSSLRPQFAATHQPVPGILGLPYEYSRAQLNTLTGGVGRDVNMGIDGGGAYVTCRRIDGRGILFTRDVTAAQRRSDFKDLQPLRIVNAVHKAVKDIAFPFLGKPNDITHRQALTSSIKSYLDMLGDSSALLGKDGVGYSVKITGGETPISQLLGEINIDITLRPALQIKVVKVRVRLTL